MQFTGTEENLAELFGFVTQRTLRFDPDAVTITIETLEGDMLARKGDWIIKGVAGECYPCKPDIFERTYEPVARGNIMKGVMIFAVLALLPASVMWLWNWLMPDIFGITTINYWQALGLMVLTSLLFYRSGSSKARR